MGARLDRILGELEARYGLDREFSARVRPVAEKIFDPLTPAEARPAPLTRLAELYDRQARVRRDCRAAARGIKELFAEIVGLLADAWDLEEPPSPGRDEGDEERGEREG